MKVAMVVESMFGNTEVLAESVAHGMRDRGAEVVVVRPGDAHDLVLGDLDLLVVAAPTHALSMSRAGTRADAVTQGADAARATTGVREWLAGLSSSAPGTTRPPVAVFDTRARIARHWPGSASRPIVRALRRQGFTVTERTSFYVGGVKGPILRGETQRARHWGQSLTPAPHRDAGPVHI